MSFSDYQNLRFLIQLFKRQDNESAIMVLGDGDSTGKGILKRIADLATGLNVPKLNLRDNSSIANYCLFAPQFLVAVRKAILNAYSTENRNPPDDLEGRIEKSWSVYLGEPKVTAGRWFKDLAQELFGDEVSKVVLARNYVEACRGLTQPTPNAGQVEEATILCQAITKALQLPSMRGFALP